MTKSRKKIKKDKKIKSYIKNNKGLFTLYLVLRILVIGIMVMQLLKGNYHNVFLCVLTLVLFMIPSFVERRLKIDVPDTLEVVILLFIFAAEILGEINEYFVRVPHWDTMLHTLNGFLMAAIGIALIDVLNRTDRFAFNMSPLFVALVAFCFSMTIGVLWEFFEFVADMITRSDMQKDTIVSTISSVTLHPEGRNIPIVVTDISKTVIWGSINGVPQEITINGYLDIGLIDTMKDLLVNFVGAVVFSVIGFFYIKSRGKGKIARRFIPTMLSDSDAVSDDTPDTNSKT